MTPTQSHVILLRLSQLSLGLFLSTFHNKIDTKGRVSVPASFRAALAGQSFQGIVVFRSLLHPAVEGFGMDRMEKLSQQMDSMDLFSQSHDDWAASIFADAQQLAFDENGRITLTKTLMEHGHLTNTVAFVGRGPTFQLWNPEMFAAHQSQARQRLIDAKKNQSSCGSGPEGVQCGPLRS